MHTDDPAESANLPTKQFEHAAAPKVDHVPASHDTQSVSPPLAVYLPAAQATHAVADNGDVAYFPAPHSMQFVSPSLAVCLPAAHATQSVSPSLAVYLPAAQCTHAVADNGDTAYFPAPHVTQSASPSLAVCLPAHSGKSASRSERHGVHRKLHVGVVVT